MAFSPLNISLPEPLRAYVKAQVEAGDYGTPSNFFRDLVEHDRERRLARLESRLIDSLADQPFELPLAEIEEGQVVSYLEQRLRSSK